MSELIRIFSVMVLAIFLYTNIKITAVITVLLAVSLLFYIVTRERNIIYIILFFIFYIYLNFVTYNGDISGEKSLYVKFDGKTGTVLNIENRYTDKKILVSNKDYPYGYYKLSYKIQQIKEKNGVFIINGKIISIREGKLNYIRSYILQKLESIFENEYNIAVFAKAAVLGEKNGLDEDFNNMFKNTGLSHLIVISGLHIGLIIMFFLKIFENTIFSYRLKYILTWVLLTVYCAVVGFSVSVLRTYITGSIMIFSKIFFEEKDSRKSFFISLIVTLIILPYSLFDISFQLSYGAVGSILFVYPIFERFYTVSRGRKENFSDYIIKTGLLSLVIQIMTLPVFLYNFQILPLFSFICNIAGIPLGGLLIQLIFLALLLNVLGMEILNKVLVLLIKFIFSSFEAIVYFLDKIPLLQIKLEFQIHWIFIILYYIVITAGIQALKYYGTKYEYKKTLSIK
jgi:competence protein ComEC